MQRYFVEKMSKLSNSKEFIAKARKKHGRKYDYSKVNYLNNKTKVEIICKKHGSFFMTPNLHLAKSGCRVCSIKSRSAKQKNINNPQRQQRLQKEFIEKARKIHLKKYDYSKVKYVNAHTKVIIKCPVHGEFKQTPKHHSGDGYGCNACGFIAASKKQALNAKDFYRRAKITHKNKYTYVESEFKATASKITIICKKHGAFQQTPANHLYHKKGCKYCAFELTGIKNMMTQEDFLERSKSAHGNKYLYDKVIYKGIDKLVKIKCPKHGYFNQLPRTHIKGNGCVKCGRDKTTDAQRLNTKEFLKRAKELHGKKYDYSATFYGKNNVEKVLIRCPDHGEFLQSPVHHLQGNGCNKCINKAEGRIAEYLTKKHIVFREHKIKDRRFDFLIPDLRLIIERDGEQHYIDNIFFSKKGRSALNHNIKNDAYKTKLAKNAGFNIARIPFWLKDNHVKLELENILAGKPTYPDIPDLKQLKTRPKPKKNF